MRVPRRLALAVLLALVALGGGIGAWMRVKGSSRTGPSTSGVLKHGGIANFELMDAEGHAHELYRYRDRKAVVFLSLGSDCPADPSSLSAFGALRGEFSGADTVFLGMDSSPGKSRDAVFQEASAQGIGWPVLRDPSQQVARQLGMERASEAVVIDTRDWNIAYRGAQGEALADAVRNVVQGRAPRRPFPEAQGCRIRFKQQGLDLNYTEHIAPILKRKCLKCHTTTGSTPPYFNDYETVKGWTSMIRETVMTGKMPLWGLDSESGEFTNDNSLSPDQKRRLITWIDSGAPRGEGPDPLVGFVPVINASPVEGATFTAEVDHDIEVPPEGFPEYSWHQLGGPLPRDMWVASVDAYTTNPRAMHHATLNVTPEPLSYYQERARELREGAKDDPAVRDPDRTTRIWMGIAMIRDVRKKGKQGKGPSHYRADEDIRFPVYSTYGRNNIRRVPKGTARFLPKGHYLILETHHHGTGKPEKERTKLYFYETKKTPDVHPVHRIDQVRIEFEVPPHAKDFRLDIPPFVVDRDLYLLSCNSHMHMRGRELHSWATFPDGTRRRLLTISSFMYDWHSGFAARWAEPVFLPKGTKIESYAVVDNSSTNPYNPDPSKKVYFGQRLDRDEMPRLQCGYHYAKE